MHKKYHMEHGKEFFDNFPELSFLYFTKKKKKK